MGYPPPIPTLKGKDAEEFLRRLKNFKLTEKQKAFYKEAIDRNTFIPACDALVSKLFDAGAFRKARGYAIYPLNDFAMKTGWFAEDNVEHLLWLTSEGMLHGADLASSREDLISRLKKVSE